MNQTLTNFCTMHGEVDDDRKHLRKTFKQIPIMTFSSGIVWRWSFVFFEWRYAFRSGIIVPCDWTRAFNMLMSLSWCRRCIWYCRFFRLPTFVATSSMENLPFSSFESCNRFRFNGASIKWYGYCCSVDRLALNVSLFADDDYMYIENNVKMGTI